MEAVSHGSRYTPNSLLEATASSFAFLLGVALATSTMIAIIILGWVLISGGALGLAIVLTRR